MVSDRRGLTFPWSSRSIQILSPPLIKEDGSFTLRERAVFVWLPGTLSILKARHESSRHPLRLLRAAA
jgi:hypothetical protein